MFHQAFYFYSESFDKYDSIMQASVPIRHDMPVRRVAAGCRDADRLPDSLEDGRYHHSPSSADSTVVAAPCLSQTEKEQMLSGNRLTQYLLELDDRGYEQFATDSAILFARMHSSVPVKMIPYLEHLHTRMMRVIEQITPVTQAMLIDRELVFHKLQQSVFHPKLQSAGICRLIGRMSEHRLFYDHNERVFGVADDGQIRFGSPYEDLGWFVHAWGIDSARSAFMKAYQSVRKIGLADELLRGFYALTLLQEVTQTLGLSRRSTLPEAFDRWERLDSSGRQHVWMLMERVLQVYGIAEQSGGGDCVPLQRKKDGGKQ